MTGHGFASHHLVVTPPNTNRRLSFPGPSIKLSRLRMAAGSCREAVLAALRTGGPGGEHSAAEVHAMLAATGGTWSVQTVYKTMRRMVCDDLLSWRGGLFRLMEPTPLST